MWFRLWFLFSVLLFVTPLFRQPILYANDATITDDSARILERSRLLVQFYELQDGVDLIEITDQIMESPIILDSRKELFRTYGRRTFVFSYPSDGLKVKALISFVESPENNPTMVFLRGGNRIFGITSPGSDIMTFENYTVLASTYRDGVSEGTDEFGGKDVNDVKALVDYIPELERKLAIHIQQERMYLMGGSRGGMQMFLALARFPELQSRLAKVVSLSGILDIRQTMAVREDMWQMFVDDFGYVEGDEEWINYRNPLLAADTIMAGLPILIVQGTDDIRVTLDEGYHMVDKLQASGCDATYWEFDGGDHCLGNKPDYLKLIAAWLEESATAQ